MERPWTFSTDTPADAFCREIAAEMVREFGIAEAEAVGRINRGWGHLTEFDPIAYHNLPRSWAHHFYYGPDSYWWIGDELKRERLGLGPLTPARYS
jgi:hypothetical protein